MGIFNKQKSEELIKNFKKFPWKKTIKAFRIPLKFILINIIGGPFKLFFKLGSVLKTLIIIVPLLFAGYYVFINYIGIGNTVRVTGFTPGKQAETIHDPVIIDFNKPIAPADKLNKPVNPDVLTVKPALSGVINWESESRVVFSPSDAYQPGVHYLVQLNKKLVKEFGRSFAGPVKFKFYSPSLKIVQANIFSIYDADSSKISKLKGEIKFNYPVSKTGLEKSIKVSVQGIKKQPLDIQIEGKEKEFVFTFLTAPLDYKLKPKNITLLIDKSLISSLGGKEMENDYKVSIGLEERAERKVTDIRPLFEDNKVKIQLTFNMPVDPKTASPYIEADPKISFTADGSQSIINLKGNFTIGSAYTIKIKTGLPGKDGSIIKKEQLFSVPIEDLPSEIKFENAGKYLPKNGALKIGFSSVNIDDIHIEITRLHKNNIVHFLNSGNDYYYRNNYFMHSVFFTNIELTAERNKKTMGYIDLGKLINSKYPGVYQITLRTERRYWDRKVLSLLSTDLAISAKLTSKDILVFVNNLSSFEPVSGAKVTLVSRDNQELLTLNTGSDGFAVFKDYKARIQSVYEKESPEYQPYVLMVEKGDDLSYLKLDDSMINTSVFDVGGSPYNEGEMDAFIYTERGVYRPGEDVNISGIVRGENYSIPPSIPMTLIITGPTGEEIRKIKAAINDGGMFTIKVNIASYEKTGLYTVKLQINNNISIGESSFRVEDFMPNKIKVELKLLKNVFASDEFIQYTVKGTKLFGPPASGSKVRSEIRFIDEAFRPDKYKDYVFEIPEQKMKDCRQELPETVLDENGEHSFGLNVPDAAEPTGLLRGVIYAEVRESGGRAVAVVQSVKIKKNTSFLGIKKISKNDQVDKAVQFSIVALDESGNPTTIKDVKVSVYKTEWYHTSYRQGRGYEWKYEEKESLILEKEISKVQGEFIYNFTPKSYHHHKIVVECAKKNIGAKLKFYPYSWDYDTTMDMTPGRLNVKLNKSSYKPGDKALVTVGASGPGMLLITAEKDKIIYKKCVKMNKNTMTVEVPVDETFTPNFYITAAVLRHYSLINADRPMREFGIASANVDMSKHKLKVTLDVPKTILPKKKLTAKIKVKDAKGKAYITVMGVDEGICQITGFKVPDPFKYFTRKRALGVASFDTWNDIIEDIMIMPNMLAIGGGEGAEAADRKHLNPVNIKRVKPLSLFSGIVKLNYFGEATISFDIPSFNGSLRLMAVAHSEDRFGAGEEMIQVSDLIVITSSLPRFVGPGDRFTIPVQVFNKTGKPGKFSVKINVSGPVEIEEPLRKIIEIDNNKEKSIEFYAKTKMDTGKITFTIEAEGNQYKTEDVTDVPLRPAGQRTTYFESGRLAGKSAEFKVPADLMGKPNVYLMISKHPAIKYIESLKYLIGYPYGCLEQTTSKAMPMLFVKDILDLVDPQEFKRLGGDYYIREAIKKIENSFHSEYGISFWPGYYYYYNYTTIYASHFLLEAKRKGYTVSDKAVNLAYGFLKKIARARIEYADKDHYYYYNSLEDIVYALYVLAAFYQPDKDTMIYIREHHWNKLYLHEKAMLAAAFAYTGDSRTAKQLLPKKFNMEDEDYKYYYRGWFYSSTRAIALTLDALFTADPHSSYVGNLVEKLDRQMNKFGYWGDTHATAFALMALSKVLSQDKSSGFSGDVFVDNRKIKHFSKDTFLLNEKSFAGKTVAIKMDNNAIGYYSWSADGYPLMPDRKTMSEGLRISRKYLTKSQGNADLNNLKQGDIIIVELSVEADETLKNIALVDMLPAGLEIENTRLGMTGEINWIPERSEAEYMDIRDDRIIFFTSFNEYGRQAKKFYYAARVVTQGKFILPSLYAEAMYDTRIKANFSSGETITVGK